MNATVEAARCHDGISTTILYSLLAFAVLLMGLVSYIEYAFSKQKLKQFLLWLFFAVLSLPFLVVMATFWIRSKSFDLGLYGRRDQAYIVIASIGASAWLWACSLYFNMESDLMIYRSLNFWAAIIAASFHAAFYVAIVCAVYYCAGFWKLPVLAINYTTVANINAALIVLALVTYLAILFWLKNADQAYRKRFADSKKFNDQFPAGNGDGDIFTTGNYGYDLSPEAIEKMRYIEEIQKSRSRNLNNEVTDKMNLYTNQLFDQSPPSQAGDAQVPEKEQAVVTDLNWTLSNADGFKTIELDLDEPQAKNLNPVSRIKSMGENVGNARLFNEHGLAGRTKSAIKGKWDEKKRTRLARETDRRQSVQA